MAYTITDFIDYIDNIMLKSIDIKYKTYSSGSDSVKIMTTHASKGLEYPVCYFADLDHKFNISDIKDVFIASKEYGLIIPNTNEKTILNELLNMIILVGKASPCS